ncbi:MAG: DUF3786 domain-containing protein [Promethearchaeota archaeon]
MKESMDKIIQDRISNIDFLWNKILDLDESDEEICERCNILLNDKKKYLIPVLNKKYIVDVSRRTIIDSDSDEVLDLYNLYIVLLHYILNCKKIDLTKKYISEKEIPGGSSFFIGAHALPKQQMADLFANKINEFSRICLEFGGEQRDFGDISYELKFLPRIPVILILWDKDEEFPASAQFLFNETISMHFAPDIVWGLVDSLFTFIKDAL